MSNLKITLKMDIKGTFDRLMPSVDWAVENGVLSEQEAINILADELIESIEVQDA